MERFLTEVQKKFTFPIRLWKEGNLSFFAPDQSIYEKKDYPPSRFPVFYNPMMVINRDLTILLIKSWIDTFPGKILKFGEPLCGIGVRGLRIRETFNNINIFLNDINNLSIELLKENIKYSEIDENFVKISSGDANQFMASHSKPRERFDILDIDPFGSPVRFIDSAFRALIGDDGLLCVTATDMPPLVGIYKKACFRKYGIYPIKTEYSHELALRILITFLIREAAKHGIGIKIQFSYYHQHHVRVFVKTELGKLKANETLKELGHIFHCIKCNERYVIYLKDKKLTTCLSCNSDLESIGPIWIGKLVDDKIVHEMLKFIDDFKFDKGKKIRKMLDLILEEVKSPASFHDISRLIYEHHLKSIKLKDVIEALKNSGFIATRTHFSPIGIKTNASRKKIAEIIENLQANQ